MGKIIFMLLIAAIVWVLFKKSTEPPNRTGGDNGRTEPTDANTSSMPTGKAGAGNVAASERMVACSSCGVFMPESDSVRVNETVSCRDPVHCGHRPQSATRSTNKTDQA